MCFVLYAGTTNPLPRRKFDIHASDLSIRPLAKRDAAIKIHFSSPAVQYIGSTSRCGCDFPHATLQNGDWPTFDGPEIYDETDDVNKRRKTSDRRNREMLVSLLRTTGDK